MTCKTKLPLALCGEWAVICHLTQSMHTRFTNMGHVYNRHPFVNTIILLKNPKHTLMDKQRHGMYISKFFMRRFISK